MMNDKNRIMTLASQLAREKFYSVTSCSV